MLHDIIVVHLPVPQNVLRTFTKEDVNELLKATSNVRDYFLLYLLFETGMRIGEALSLWLEDIDISECVIRIKDRGETENLAEIKTVNSPRRIDCSNDLLEVFTEFVGYYHSEGIETNHIFIKLSGKNAGKAIDNTRNNDSNGETFIATPRHKFIVIRTINGI